MANTTVTPGPAFDRAVANAVKEAVADFHGLPDDSGIAVAIIQDKKVCFTGGFGLRNRETGKKVDANTLFAIGSATKAFTSMAASMLAEDGKIKLDGDPVRDFLPDFKLKEPDASTQMNLELILSHRSGLPRHDPLWFLGPFNRSQLYYRLRYLDPAAADFRRTFTYNNMMYGIAGDVLEVVAKKSWDALVKDRILGKLAMKATNTSLKSMLAADNYAKGYVKEEEIDLKDFSNIAPAAAINSNAVDMAKWLLLFLNDGVAPGNERLVKKDSLQKMLAPLIDADPNGRLDNAVSYGLGWYSSEIWRAKEGEEKKKLFFHQGDSVGHCAHVSFMPDPGLGVVVLTNQHCSFDLANKWPDKVAEKIYELLLGAKGANSVNFPSPRPAPRFVPPPKGDEVVHDTSDYTGMYCDNAYGDMTVNLSGSGLSINYYGSTYRLRRTTDLDFDFTVHAFGEDFPVQAKFTKAGNGKINGVGIDLSPFNGRFDPVTFAKR
jgi:CubicO group peptidase (beta-lactamase class C family)